MTEEENTQKTKEKIEKITKDYLEHTLPKALGRGYNPEKIMKLHDKIDVWITEGREMDDLISRISTAEEPQPEARPVLTAPIIGSRSYRGKSMDTGLSDVLRDTLNSAISLGGRASADQVSEITHRQTNIESSYLRELWEKGLLLTRQREGRIVFYSTPERAIEDTLKQTDKLTIDQLMTVLSEYAHDHRIERDTLLSIIESAKGKNIVKTEGDMVSLA